MESESEDSDIEPCRVEKRFLDGSPVGLADFDHLRDGFGLDGRAGAGAVA
jgi:hypothetical protein